MFKDILLVGIGSFVGGSLRMVVSKFVQLAVPGLFPWGTLAVNVVGCFLIGVFSSLSGDEGGMSPSVRLLFTTGFCGGFTTFSTFVNEGTALGRDGNLTGLALYVASSVAVGFVCLLVGNSLAKAVQ